MKIFIKSNMFVIQTNSSILSIDWFGDFLLSHSKDTIFLPMSVMIFLDEDIIDERKKFLIRLAKFYSNQHQLDYERFVRNFLRFLNRPIKIEFKQKNIIRGDVEVYLDALSPKDVKILLQHENPWIITHFVSQLNRFITEFDNRRLFLDASDDRSKSRLDRVLKKRNFLFFNMKFTYSKNFLTVLFSEYTQNYQQQQERYQSYSQSQSKSQSQSQNNSYNFNFHHENSFNSPNYYQDATLAHHYRVLELQYNASLKEVKANYRKLAKRYHPDRVHNKNQSIVELYTKKFQEIQTSYQFLKEYLEER
ncbi:MAG TPA: J domain-containing protein [Campylobacterales bacterium]|nr:J domain-containing protein [Campylobacterales bacterium]HIO71431.1 J domain-containing protein [Campylobacterales bacterium]